MNAVAARPSDPVMPPGDMIVNFAPTGARLTKGTTPHVPLSVTEIVEEVHRAVEVGITMVHLHARDRADGSPTSNADIFAELIGDIRAFAPELVICVSLSGTVSREFAARAEPLRLDGGLKPDMASLTLSSLNLTRSASVNEPETIAQLATEMAARKIAPELEVFDLGMINYARYLERKGVIEPPHYFNLFLGGVASAQADPLHAGLMIRDLPPRSTWSLGGIGGAQFAANSLAAALGGGVRVGLEDNHWMDAQRTRPATNAGLLARVHRLAEANDRKVMTSADLRELLSLHRDGPPPR